MRCKLRPDQPKNQNAPERRPRCHTSRTIQSPSRTYGGRPPCKRWSTVYIICWVLSGLLLPSPTSLCITCDPPSCSLPSCMLLRYPSHLISKSLVAQKFVSRTYSHERPIPRRLWTSIMELPTISILLWEECRSPSRSTRAGKLDIRSASSTLRVFAYSRWYKTIVRTFG